eukprot:3682787-Amphidinium_carterae.2
MNFQGRKDMKKYFGEKKMKNGHGRTEVLERETTRARRMPWPTPPMWSLFEDEKVIDDDYSDGPQPLHNDPDGPQPRRPTEYWSRSSSP